MLLKASPALSLLSSGSGSGSGGNLFPPSRNSSNLLFSPSGSRFSIQAAKGTNTKSLTGVVFEPFEEVKKELELVPTTPFVSLARHKFSDDSESAINDQIKYVLLLSFCFIVSLFFRISSLIIIPNRKMLKESESCLFSQP